MIGRASSEDLDDAADLERPAGGVALDAAGGLESSAGAEALEQLGADARQDGEVARVGIEDEGIGGHVDVARRVVVEAPASGGVVAHALDQAGEVFDLDGVGVEDEAAVHLGHARGVGGVVGPTVGDRGLFRGSGGELVVGRGDGDVVEVECGLSEGEPAVVGGGEGEREVGQRPGEAELVPQRAEAGGHEQAVGGVDAEARQVQSDDGGVGVDAAAEGGLDAGVLVVLAQLEIVEPALRRALAQLPLEAHRFERGDVSVVGPRESDACAVDLDGGWQLDLEGGVELVAAGQSEHLEVELAGGQVFDDVGGGPLDADVLNADLAAPEVGELDVDGELAGAEDACEVAVLRRQAGHVQAEVVEREVAVPGECGEVDGDVAAQLVAEDAFEQGREVLGSGVVDDQDGGDGQEHEGGPQGAHEPAPEGGEGAAGWGWRGGGSRHEVLGGRHEASGSHCALDRGLKNVEAGPEAGFAAEGPDGLAGSDPNLRGSKQPLRTGFSTCCMRSQQRRVASQLRRSGYDRRFILPWSPMRCPRSKIPLLMTIS